MNESSQHAYLMDHTWIITKPLQVDGDEMNPEVSEFSNDLGIRPTRNLMSNVEY